MKDYRNIIIALLIIIIIISTTISIYNIFIHKNEEPVKEYIEDISFNKDSILQNPKHNLYNQLIEYGVLYPEIVYAQAILETGNFTSNVFKTKNNLFGLYNSKAKDYYQFEDWLSSILGYKNLIQYKYNEDEDYYHFLERINYAEDSLYIKKLKEIVSSINFSSLTKEK